MFLMKKIRFLLEYLKSFKIMILNIRSAPDILLFFLIIYYFISDILHSAPFIPQFLSL